jgi:hypothetical protein
MREKGLLHFRLSCARCSVQMLDRFFSCLQVEAVATVDYIEHCATIISARLRDRKTKTQQADFMKYIVDIVTT